MMPEIPRPHTSAIGYSIRFFVLLLIGHGFGFLVYLDRSLTATHPITVAHLQFFVAHRFRLKNGMTWF